MNCTLSVYKYLICEYCLCQFLSLYQQFVSRRIQPLPQQKTQQIRHQKDICLKILQKTNNNSNDENDQKENLEVNHFCLKCKSHSLTLEGLNTYEGKRIQIINCNRCGYEWQESWILPNWLWIKSSLLDNHWTSERWNQRVM